MLATDYLLQRQQDLINKQADMIKELRQEIENKQEIIDMHFVNFAIKKNQQVHPLRNNVILSSHPEIGGKLNAIHALCQDNICKTVYVSRQQ